MYEMLNSPTLIAMKKYCFTVCARQYLVSIYHYYVLEKIWETGGVDYWAFYPLDRKFCYMC